MSKDLKTYVLENETHYVELSNIGASLIKFIIKTKDNHIDVVLGHQNLEDYLENPGNLGCIVGRNANRIEDANVTINNKVYRLENNDNGNNLHNGRTGLQYVIFNAKEEANKVIFSHRVKDLEDGFPGNLDISITYTLNGDTLSIDYDAMSDKDTLLNITNHSYFNLNGQDLSTIYNHELLVNSELYMPNHKTSIPTKEIKLVKDSDFDFTLSRSLSFLENSEDEQIKMFNGFDHNFLINQHISDKVVDLKSEESKLHLAIYTDMPAFHVYTANHFPDYSTQSKGGGHYPLHGGIAFETQFSPNSLRMPWLKSPILKANTKFHSYTRFTLNEIKN